MECRKDINHISYKINLDKLFTCLYEDGKLKKLLFCCRCLLYYIAFRVSRTFCVLHKIVWNLARLIVPFSRFASSFSMQSIIDFNKLFCAEN